MIDRTCLHCKKTFQVASKYSNMKLCSVECRFKQEMPDKFDADTCFEWTKSKNPVTGYGQINSSTAPPAKPIYTHRLSYVIFNGQLDSNDVVRHTCDNPSCVNPLHLLKGKQADNVRDMWERGRQQSYKNLPTGDKNPSRALPERLIRGSRHWQTRLNESDVVLIRESKETNAELGRRYKMSPEAISAIRKRLTWRHVD